MIDFMKHHPETILLTKGSTAARTRLYQIGISENIEVINHFFKVEGYYKNDWEPFKKNKNYIAFMIKAKKN